MNRPIASVVSVLLVGFVLAAAIAACRGGGANPSDIITIPSVVPTTSSHVCLNDQYPPNAPSFDEIPESDYQQSSSGVQYAIISESGGVVPGEDWQVEVLYTGWLEDGCIFGTTYILDRPARFFVQGVIPGWSESIREMHVGERRRVRIPPELGYGSVGSPPRIPGNATLTFDIILVGTLSGENVGATATAANEAANTTATAVSIEVAATVTAIVEEAERAAEEGDDDSDDAEESEE